MVRLLLRTAVFLASSAIGLLVTAVATLILPVLIIRGKAASSS